MSTEKPPTQRQRNVAAGRIRARLHIPAALAQLPGMCPAAVRHLNTASTAINRAYDAQAAYASGEEE